MKTITLAHSDLTKTIYAIIGKEKIDITDQAIAEVKAIKALEQEPKTVSIPKGATNGDVIKALFPSVEVKEKNNGYEVYVGIGTACQYFNYQWWNSLYESEGE